ncbi:hypothetical protein Tco_0107916 [Tanacetum coccineum]
MSTYLKHMGRYKHNQLKGKSYDEIQKLYDKEMKRVNTFVAMNSEAQESSGKKDDSRNKKVEISKESSSKRAGEALQQESAKKQKVDVEEAEIDEDQEEAQMKKYMEIVMPKDIPIDAIPLSTNPPCIVDYKIIKERMMGYFQIIRGGKQGNGRLEESYERVLWGDLKVTSKCGEICKDIM